jgi:2-polyprenyl-3-methyl-5-hydroxy-6-metoxy-1,4-benzoquinol methylase
VTATVYAFNNDSAHASMHHDALSALLDPASREFARQLLDLRGARCLDVAAGGGGFAHWLAAEVGAGGRVLATDLNPSRIGPAAHLEVIKHDIVAEEIPDAGTWNFVHARLLLNHLPARRAVLAKLADALAPGGVLLTEDWYSEPPGEFVAYGGDASDRELLSRYHAANLAVLDLHGNTRRWATAAHQAMREEGLERVRTVVSAESWVGGSPGTKLLTASVGQLYEELLEQGLSPAELDRVCELFADPAVTFHGHRLYSTSGRRPL